jgi:uncharacterized damage-inducible protein DinB
MKKLLIVLPVLFFAVSVYADAINKEERKFAIKFLKQSEKDLKEAVKGLSPAQLAFKPSADAWSIEETLKHIAISEQNLWMMMDGTIKAPANPEKRSNIKATDEQLIQMMENRTQKFKTNEKFEPKNTPYTSAMDAMNSFHENRKSLISYMKKTDEDLRNHVATTPAGDYDAYQVGLFIGGHTNRHRLQIQEVKANPNFPKG